MSVYRLCGACRAGVESKRHREGCDGKRSSWAFVVDVGRDQHGRRRQRKRAGFRTKRDAERAEREVLVDLDRGSYVETSRVTVGEFLAGEWLASCAPPRVAPSTHHKRRYVVETLVAPRIGGVALQDLNPAHLSRLYTDLLAAGRVDGHGGLSPATVHDVHRIVRKALADAVRWGLVARNPSDLADPPPQRVVQAQRRAAMTTWTGDEVARFLASTAGHDLHPVWVLAATTGLRRSELLGLRWGDVDLDAATLSVAQTQVLDAHGGWTLRRDAKTRTSGRTIALDARTVTVLRAHRARQVEQRLAAGAGRHDLGLVFTRADGNPLRPPALSMAFRRACAAIDLPRIRFHDLRHSAATLMQTRGVASDASNGRGVNAVWC